MFYIRDCNDPRVAQVKTGEAENRVVKPEHRQQLRQRLIAAREALAPAEHAAMSAAIECHLNRLLLRLAPKVVGFCWPYRGEFDCRPVVMRLIEAGAQAALPVIVAKAKPMLFREWTPHSPMSEGRYGIRVPVDGATLAPDLVLMPLNGFDDLGYRLGYGGGYFDRTLAALPVAPVAVGVGFELARLDSILPHAHDIPMSYVITEAGLRVRRNGRLEPGR
jgi:5-formyltetrahydrofolate cyclo-ligase